MKSDSYGIASRANGSARGMRDRACLTRVGSTTERPWDEHLAAVGKPYKFPGWSTVRGELPMPDRTRYGSENCVDSTWG
jgi:hypothetical protein